MGFFIMKHWLQFPLYEILCYRDFMCAIETGQLNPRFDDSGTADCIAWCQQAENSLTSLCFFHPALYWKDSEKMPLWENLAIFMTFSDTISMSFSVCC